MFNNNITNKLKNLNSNYGAHALKASFEDEGVTDADLNDLILLSGDTKLKVYVKIGGCEANRDIETCLRMGIRGIVAPMVESDFAVSKFIDSVAERCSLFAIPYSPKLFVNLETETACKNAKKIIKKHHKNLSGIVVGRSDLSKSLGLSKANVNDTRVMNVVRDTLNVAKDYNLQTKMGGTVSRDSSKLIYELWSNGLLDFFETRAVIFKLENVENIKKSIGEALSYEQMLLKRRHHFHSVKSSFFDSRVQSIEVRK
jgi:hypothetical protein|tara:strand:+ start:20444 stop:21214 length:771 start_codon:yes stop_codon:yes gene_type:complete